MTNIRARKRRRKIKRKRAKVANYSMPEKELKKENLKSSLFF